MPCHSAPAAFVPAYVDARQLLHQKGLGKKQSSHTFLSYSILAWWLTSCTKKAQIHTVMRWTTSNDAFDGEDCMTEGIRIAHVFPSRPRRSVPEQLCLLYIYLSFTANILPFAPTRNIESNAFVSCNSVPCSEQPHTTFEQIQARTQCIIVQYYACQKTLRRWDFSACSAFRGIMRLSAIPLSKRQSYYLFSLQSDKNELKLLNIWNTLEGSLT